MSGLKIKKGDKVEVLSGKYKGKQGRVLKSFPADGRIIIEGINLVKKHSRPTQENPQGGIITKEAPIDISNVALVCDSCNSNVRVGFRVEADSSKRRICRKCGADLE